MKTPAPHHYQERTVYGLKKRVARGVKRLLGTWRRKQYDIRIVSVEGRARYKKIVFQSARRAGEVHATLTGFGASRHFPAPVSLERETLTVDFVPGKSIPVVDEAMLPRLSDFYAHVYRRDAQQQPLTQTWTRLEQNLRRLQELQVIADSTEGRVLAHARMLAPEQVWIGYDYTDPISNNLIISEHDGCICAIDVKNLRAQTLIGQGIAKARSRWLVDAWQRDFFQQLQARGAPDFESYFPFVQLFDQVQRVSNKLVAESRIKTSKKLKSARKKPLVFDDFVV